MMAEVTMTLLPKDNDLYLHNDDGSQYRLL